MSPRLFILINALFCAARMSIGAISVVYMQSKGISLEDVANVKIIQAVIILLAEFPSGLMADYWGRKKCVLLAQASAILSFVFYIFGGAFWHFAMAEVFNALTLAFWSGAFEALLFDSVKNEKQQKYYFERIFTQMSLFGALSTMIGGYIGACVSDIDSVYPFIFAASLMTATLILSLYVLPEFKKTSHGHVLEKKTKIFFNELKSGCAQVYNNSFVKTFLIIQVFIQFSIQPMLHYWQPYFKEFAWYQNDENLGRLFFLYVGAGFLLSILNDYLLKKERVSPYLFSVFYSLLSMITLVLLSSQLSVVTATLSFLILTGSVGSVRTLISARFNQGIEKGSRASILSFISLFSRLGMFASLTMYSILGARLTIAQYYGVSALGLLLIMISVFKWYRVELVEPSEVTIVSI